MTVIGNKGYGQFLLPVSLDLKYHFKGLTRLKQDCLIKPYGIIPGIKLRA